MRRQAASLLLAGVAALALVHSLAAVASAAMSFTPCPQDPSFSCARLAVPLDRSGTLPGTITLSVERRTAAAAPSGTAVLALAGGPGQATLPLAGFIAEAIAPALAAHDLLLFDQRGTGSSGPLSCPALNTPALVPTESVAQAIDECALQIGPARGNYTTRESVEDIEALRIAAGYEKLVLYGTSYGTKVALEYAARYPQHVAALVLDSTETPNGPEPFALTTFKAMGPALEELCSHGACAGIAHAPVSELARLVAKTSSHPLAGIAYSGRGTRVKKLIHAEDLFAAFLAGDENPALRAELPSAVHSALAHDPAPLARMLELGGVHPPSEEQTNQIDGTLFLDTICEETHFPWQRGAPEDTRGLEAEAALGALPRSDFYPFAPASGLMFDIPLCISWPDASPAAPPVGPEPNVPTLVLSGDQDLRTPVENALRVAQLIPDAQVLRVPYTGHSVLGSDLSGCARTALAAFFASQPIGACSSVTNHFPPTPLAPTRVSALPGLPGVSGERGRTATAAVDSLLDLRRTVVELALAFGQLPTGLPFGGLRGGTAALSKAGVQLKRFSYVPGVTLSGFVPGDLLLRNKGAAATLSVAGGAGASGRLRLAAGGRLSGTLAGRSFHADVSARVKLARAALASGRFGETVSSLPIPALARLR